MLEKEIKKTLIEVYGYCSEIQLQKIINLIKKIAVFMNLDINYVAFCFKELFYGNFRVMYNRLDVLIFKPKATLFSLSIEKKDLDSSVSILEDVFQDF